ncbi:ribosome biogenesis protein [Pisolithus thermaeus]|nr:ribosome biogenesis protein [Pisolithus thermaeus]
MRPSTRRAAIVESDMARLKTEKGHKQKSKGSQKNQEKDVSKPKKLQAKNVSESSKLKADSLQLDASPRWYDDVPSLQPAASNAATLTPEKLSSLLDRATSLHASVVNASQSTSTVTSSSSDYSFLQNILRTGTLSDRLSALTLLVQSSPLHNTKALEALKNLAERGKGKGGRGESLKALRCIVDWWVGGGAPDRKLKYFRDQPLSHPDINDRHLVIWYFEDWLKKYFFSVLQILEVLSADPLSYVRMQALSLVFTLLKEKPEQEQNLLRLLTNKLGDSDKTICSRSSYYILQLLQVHPSMKAVVIREITSLVLRPGTSTAATAPPPTQNTHIRFNKDGSDPKPKSQPKSKSKAGPASKQPVNEHARYYASITLNQIMFRPNEKDVAMQTIDVYFRLFEDILGEGRLAEEENDDTRSEISQTHDKSRQKRKGKEVVGEGGFTEVEDSLSKLLSAILTGVNRALPFAKLGATDSSLGKHIDTLFLITHKSTFNISLQALVLIQQISSTLIHQSKASPASSSQSKSITDRYYRALYASLHDGRLASSSKQTMYLNLLFKSLKADGNVERIKSFVRRFMQVLVSGGAGGNEFIVGGLYLLGEIFSTLPGLRNLLHGTQSSLEEDAYDPRKRDPQFAQPSTSPLFELVSSQLDLLAATVGFMCRCNQLPLMHHYHPTISLHARQLFTSQPITSAADLNLNTLSHFLDRFVYKNPKKLRPKGSSAMQPSASAADGVGVKKTKGDAGDDVLPNEEKFWKKREEDVRVDEVFFHRYFSQKHRRSKVTKREGDEEGDESGEGELESDDELSQGESVSADDPDAEEEEEESDLDEKAIWKAMKATMPAMEGDDELPSELDDEDEDLPFEQSEEDEDLLSQQDDEGDEDPSSSSEDDDEGDEDISFEEGDEDDEEVEVEVEEDETSDRDDADEPDDAFSLAEASDDDDLLAVDDMPGLIEYDGSDVSAEDGEGSDEQTPFGGGRDKRKRKGKSEDKERKLKKRKTLPTFASYEDYAKMIEDGPEDNI